jgi:CheY-like chemotaxis protein/signal transduction histidine kinase
VIREKEELSVDSDVYQFYIPVLGGPSGKASGNVVVTLDYRKYFTDIFTEFNLRDYQWQWVLGGSGDVLFSNYDGSIEYMSTASIVSQISEGYPGNEIHPVFSEGKQREVISSYYSTNLLDRDFAIVFSAPTEFFQKYIIRNSVLIVAGTLLLVHAIFLAFYRYTRSQKQEFEKLSASENMLLKLIDGLPAGVVIFNEKREVIKANNLAASLYGFWSGEHMKGKLLPEAALYTGSGNMLPGKGGSHNEYRLVRKDGDASGSVILINTQPVSFRGEDARIEIHTDVSFLETARQKEIVSNARKSEYLRRMGFELRTPLTGIIGIADLLGQHRVNDEMKDELSLLGRSADIIMSIADEISDLQGIAAGNSSMEETGVDIREEMKYCAELASLRLAARVPVHWKVDGNVPASIIGNPYRIRQVLLNIIGFTAGDRAGREITVGLSSEKSLEGQIKLHFDILDTGTAFSQQALSDMFSEDVAMDNKVIAADTGTGLGTVIAGMLIKRMGGELSAGVADTAGGAEGTRVSFTFSTYSNDRAMKDINIEGITAFDQIKVLVITGNQRRDEDLLGLMHRIGLTVSVTSFTRTTINQVKANLEYSDDRFKMILIIGDDELNGFNVAQQLWENNLTGKYIVMLAGTEDRKGTLQKCISMGVDHYFIRPVDAEMLSGAIVKSFPGIDLHEPVTDLENVRKDLRILLVEDNKMNQKVLVSLLAALGYGCDVAEEGYEGVIKAREGNYDLIFMDLVLPEIDGFEAAQKIVSSGSPALIVAFTADSMPESKKKAEMSGIRDYLSKPVRLDDIKALLSRHFKVQ